jgi:hypothetical protein
VHNSRILTKRLLAENLEVLCDLAPVGVARFEPGHLVPYEAILI